MAFTIELPGGGYNGFDVPPSGISKILKETLPGIYEFGKYVVEKN